MKVCNSFGPCGWGVTLVQAIANPYRMIELFPMTDDNQEKN
jgi:hypothetical protein